MKKRIAIMLTVGLLAAIPAPASAGGHGGYSGHGGYYGYGVGGFSSGLLGGAILGAALSYSYEMVYAPAPRVYSAPPEQVWVPGRYETRYQRQWVPGHREMERYSRHGEDDEDDDGYSRSGRGWIPGRYEEVRMRVWLPGHWEEGG